MQRPTELRIHVPDDEHESPSWIGSLAKLLVDAEDDGPGDSEAAVEE